LVDGPYIQAGEEIMARGAGLGGTQLGAVGPGVVGTRRAGAALISFLISNTL